MINKKSPVKFYHYLFIICVFCGGNSHASLSPKEENLSDVTTYFMEDGNIEVIETGNVRLIKNKKDHYYDLAFINPKSRALSPCILSHITKDKVSVTRFYKDLKTKSNTRSIHYFDCKMQPTLRHGYHQAHYQYYSLFPKKKASKSFKGTQGQATTLFEGDVAKCEYVYPLLFPHFCFIFFLGTDGQQVDLIQKNVKIRAIFYDFTPEFDRERLFPKNMMMYYSEGDMSFFQNFTRDQQDLFFDALL